MTDSSSSFNSHVMLLSAPDKLGLVAAVSGCLHKNNCNIEESAQFNDHLAKKFFMRVVYTPLKNHTQKIFEDDFSLIAKPHHISWQTHPVSSPTKVLILTSQWDHCLNDLLYRWRTQHLNIDITGIVSNHETSRSLVETHGLNFYYLPITTATKNAQESSLHQLVQDTHTELIILARYMQILSPDFCAQHNGRIINIHHSFLPGFKGAKPYAQAYERGVKVIGATAHFATSDLDEGPIIAQNTQPVDHAFTPRKMQLLGRDIEAKTLAEAVQLYSERRIFIEDKRTIIL